MESHALDSEAVEGKVEKESVMSAGGSKKAEKKTVRALAILKKDTGLEESKEVTRTIFVCNAGLVTGCSSSGMFSNNIQIMSFEMSNLRDFVS